MLFEIVTNTCAWAALQLGLAALANRIPHQRFDTATANWERNGRIFTSLGVRAWKDKLPDAGNWLGGEFSKSHLRGRTVAELRRFAREARRGELVHWWAIGALPLFTLWNGWSGMLINAAYAFVANIPCIIVQRYNRARIAQLLRRSHKHFRRSRYTTRTFQEQTMIQPSKSFGVSNHRRQC